jgi:hypothetical protein
MTARKSKETFLIAEPYWKKWQSANTAVDQEHAFKETDYFVHYEIDNKAKSTAMRTWIKKQNSLTRDQQQALTKLPDWYLVNYGKYAWIAQKLGFMAPSIQQHLETLLPEWLKRAEEIKNVPLATDEDIISTETTKKVVNIQERMWEQLIELCGAWDETLDLVVNGDVAIGTFDPYTDMRTYREGMVKPAHAKMIKDEYQFEYDEAVKVVEWQDADIKEAYGFMSVKQRKSYLEFFDKIITACNTYINTGKAQRKTKKPKAVKKEKLVEKLKYQVNDNDLGVASINPIDVIDCKELWVFNTKTRKLGVYFATELSTGLSVKGTSITNFTEHNSIQKTLRKPKDQLVNFKGNSKTKYGKAFAEISSTETKLNGRINDQTILLKAF